MSAWDYLILGMNITTSMGYQTQDGLNTMTMLTIMLNGSGIIFLLALAVNSIVSASSGTGETNTARVMSAECIQIFTYIGSAIYIIVTGPIFTQMLPIFAMNTPLYWFNYLHGGMFLWIIQMVYFILLVVCGLSSANVIISAFSQKVYFNDY
jgi:hypothetical protein